MVHIAGSSQPNRSCFGCWTDETVGAQVRRFKARISRLSPTRGRPPSVRRASGVGWARCARRTRDGRRPCSSGWTRGARRTRGGRRPCSPGWTGGAGRTRGGRRPCSPGWTRGARRTRGGRRPWSPGWTRSAGRAPGRIRTHASRNQERFAARWWFGERPLQWTDSIDQPRRHAH